MIMMTITKKYIVVIWMTIIITVIQIMVALKLHVQLKSSVPKPDKSTFDENWVFNIIVQNYIRPSNRVKFRSR